MQFKVTGRSRSGITEIEIKHGDAILTYPVQGYNNAAIHDAPNLFTQMNDFISRHPLETQARLFDSRC